MRLNCRPWILGWLLAGCCVVSSAQEALLLSEEAGGILELEDEIRFELSGLTGKLSVRLGRAGELRFAARSLEDRDVERPVSLWLDGRILRIGPIEGSEPQPLRLEVTIPAELETRIDASDSELTIGGLHGSVEVRGERLKLIARSIDGDLDLELNDSRAQVAGVTQSAEVYGTDLDVRLEGVNGQLSLTLEGGSAGAERLLSDLIAELDGTALTVNGVAGSIDVDASGARVALAGAEAGAKLDLTEAPLDLRGTRGEISVETDSEVSFEVHEGTLRILSRGGAVRGSQAKGGPLEIETSDAEVKLENFESPTLIRGSSLDVNVKDCKGELTVETAYSTIVVENSESPLNLNNEFGDIQIIAAKKLVTVASQDGAIRIEDQEGPAEIHGSGPAIEVTWASLAGFETSTVENAGGDVRVNLPPTVRIQIDAEAPHGRVETDLADLRLTDDGRFAAGLLRGGRGAAPHVKRPTVRLKAAGDVYIYGTSALEAAGQ